jgi:protocatechuate 3,4-dioxygenase beta subunit
VVCCATATLLVTAVPSAALAEPTATTSPSSSPSANESATPSPSVTSAESPGSGTVTAAELTVRWDAQSGSEVRTVSISRGDTVDLTGRATAADGTPVTGVTVVLKRGAFDGRTTPPADATTWSEASRATTGPDGTFRFGVAPTESSVFRAESADAAATSASYPVAVRSTMTIRIGTRAIRTVPDGSKTRLNGTATDSSGQAVPDLPLTIDRRPAGGTCSTGRAPLSPTRTRPPSPARSTTRHGTIRSTRPRSTA